MLTDFAIDTVRAAVTIATWEALRWAFKAIDAAVEARHAREADEARARALIELEDR